ncbi:MAG: PH domain-containing protein [Lutibacter sp.]|uniref:PH domain-containing protein n=1 Tax=Lutibacter sp. TaxID=1925666 RepID=UPI0018246B26|nr:PH domain-containing protein [Lutibacter sp.]MBT8317784.1 PH domain-containing protein [Lutibacter sp.]NNJ58642.1 PH domain-containing protein [Lutibacter sp.]
MNPEIEYILETEEKVLWSGKQDLKSLLTIAFLCSGVALFIALLLFFNLGDVAAHKTVKLGSNPTQVFKIILFVLIGISVLIPFAFYMNFKATDYLVTNKRLIIKSGIIGADIRSIYYDQIKSSFVNVDLIGKLFGSGTILMDTGRITQSRKRGSKTAYDRFRFIKDPYQVYKLAQKGLSSRKEGIHSGRADFESNLEGYKDFVQETEKMKRDIK